MRLTRTTLATAVVTALAFTTVLIAKPARFTTIDYPGAVATFAYGINAAGDIVGSYIDTAGKERGFVLSDGTFTSLEWSQDATSTQAWGVNPRGDIVGQYWLSRDGLRTVHGFLLRDGELLAIDVPGQPNTMPVRINAEGTIVGCYHESIANGGTLLDTMYGFTWDSAGVTSHPMARTMHNGVNPDGAVVGTYFSPTSGRAEQSYLVQDGVTTWFIVEGSVVTQAQDVSANGTIVGWHRTTMTGPLPQFHGLVIEEGAMTSFDVPGATETRAFVVSPSGDIVGYYGDAAGVHGFVRS